MSAFVEECKLKELTVAKESKSKTNNSHQNGLFSRKEHLKMSRNEWRLRDKGARQVKTFPKLAKLS